MDDDGDEGGGLGASLLAVAAWVSAIIIGLLVVADKVSRQP